MVDPCEVWNGLVHKLRTGCQRTWSRMKSHIAPPFATPSTCGL